MRTLSRTARPGDGARLRALLVAGDAILALAVVQLALTVVLIGPYVDWFLADHGFGTRATAPDGEVAGIYLAVGLRCLFSLAWVSSYARLSELVASRRRSSYLMLAAYAGIAVLGYGWLTLGGGPWWITDVRATQLALAVVMLALLGGSSVRRRLSTAG